MPTFRGVSFPGYIQNTEEPVVARLRQAEVLRGGSYSQGTLISAKSVRISAIIPNIVSLADQRAALDTIYTTFQIGVIGDLVLNDDRIYQAEVVAITDVRDPAKFVVGYQVEFSVPSGSAQAVNELTSTWGGGDTPTLSVAGNTRTWPRWEISLSSVSGSATVTIANSTTAEVFTFSPTTTTMRVLDTDNNAITAGGTDVTPEWKSGEFPTLVPGNNSLVFTYSNCTVSSVTVRYKPRLV